MKRPLGFVALLYGGGLLLGEFSQPPLAWLFLASLALTASALLWARGRGLLLWPLVVLTGWTNLVWHAAVVSPHDLRLLLGDAPEDVAVRGTLLETPMQRVYSRPDGPASRTQARLRVNALERGGRWQPAHGRIVVTMPGGLPRQYFAGQEVVVSGILAPPPAPAAEGLFDYRAWLRRQGVYYQLRASDAADWRRLSAVTRPPLSDRFLSWAQDTLARGLPGEDEALRLIWSMTLGWKTALADDVYEPFVESGTMHIFAISGLHIALIAGILVSLLRVFQVSRAWCGLVVVPLIWFYTAATGWQPSAIRSTIMMTIVVGGWSLKRPRDLLNSLAAAALIILLADPQQLFQASFQLSFFVVLSIALFLPPLEKVRDRWLAPDPWLAPKPAPRWQRLLGGPLRFASGCAAVSLAAWLGSLPLTAHYFHLFSPVTLLANMLIIPLSSAALACNLGSLFCGAWLPGASELFNHAGWFWMRLMMELSQLATTIPGACFRVRSPSLAEIVVYYSALVAVLSGFAFSPRRRRWSAFAAAGLAAICLFPRIAARESLVLTVIPLNGGCSIYARPTPPPAPLLIDCGSRNAAESVVIPFLQAQGMNRLPRLALTHGDGRQAGGAELLLARLPLGQVATSSATCRSPSYRRLLAALEKTPERWRVVDRGEALSGWTVLHPDREDRFRQADDAALVLRGRFGGRRVLLLSDLGREGQEALLRRTPDLRADVVVAGLPDKGEPLCEGLLEAIRPGLVVIADSEFPATRRAGERLRRRLEARGIPVLYTRTAGAVTLQVRAGHWEVRTMNGLRLAGPPGP